MSPVCHLCGLRLGSIKSLNQHIYRRSCTTVKNPRSVDASDLVARLDGLSSTDAARACAVDASTVRRWRRTGLVSPEVLTAAMNVLDGRDDPPPPRRAGQPKSSSVMVDVHCTWTADGWIVDAYRHGKLDPIDTVAMVAASGTRWPTLHDAHAFARRRFGRQLAALTPAAVEQEATA